MKKKRRLKKSVVLVLTWSMIIISISVLLGASFSFWFITHQQKNVNTITTGCFELEFKENSSSIKLNNSYPVSDEKGLRSVPYIFKVTNICDIDAKYKITLNTLDIDGEQIPDQLVKYAFYENNEIKNKSNFLEYAPVNTDTENINTTLPILKSYNMFEGVLSVGEAKDFMLKLWLSESATTEINGSRFESSLNIVSVAD